MVDRSGPILDSPSGEDTCGNQASHGHDLPAVNIATTRGGCKAAKRGETLLPPSSHVSLFNKLSRLQSS